MSSVRRLLVKSAVVVALGVVAILRTPSSASAATSGWCFEDCNEAFAILGPLCPWETPAWCHYDPITCTAHFPALGYCYAAS